MWSNSALALIVLTSSHAWSATTQTCPKRLGKATLNDVELAEVMPDGSLNPMMPGGSDPKVDSWDIDRRGITEPAAIAVMCNFRGTKQTVRLPVPADAKLCRSGPSSRQITCQ